MAGAAMKRLTYSQGAGALSAADGFLAVGYAGAGEGKNNPAMQHVRNVGPLPRAIYDMSGPECDGGLPCSDCGGTSAHKHGPFVIRLTPRPGSEMFGRAGMLWHGDNGKGTASQGCICSSGESRRLAWSEGYKEIEVVE